MMSCRLSHVTWGMHVVCGKGTGTGIQLTLECGTMVADLHRSFH